MGNVKMKAFRGYFKLMDLSYYLENTEAGAKIGINVDDEVTAIEGINTNQRVVEGVYDLQGRKMNSGSSLRGGVYIINNKKYVVK